MQLFCTSHKSLRNFKSNCEIIFLCALGTSAFSKCINIKILDIKLGKETQCHITKQLVHSFPVKIRISHPSKVMFTSASPR